MIASGRAYSTLPTEVTGIAGIEYAVTSNGAAIYRISDHTCLKQYKIRSASVDTILKMSADEPVTYEAFVDGAAYADRDFIENPVKYGTSPQAVEYVKNTRHLEPDIVQFIKAHMDELDSMDIVVRDAQMKKRIWERIAGADPEVYITSSVQQLIEISHRDAGKHTRLRFVTERLRDITGSCGGLWGWGQRRRYAEVCRVRGSRGECLRQLPCGGALSDETPQ